MNILAKQSLKCNGIIAKQGLKGAVSLGAYVVESEPTSYILVDEDGNEMAAVLTNEEVSLTATANDIRLGTTAVTNDGIIEGEKEIPSYYVSEGIKIITANNRFEMFHDYYDFKKLQALFCPFNTNLNDSVSTEKVAINNSIYNSLSTDILATIVKDSEKARIDFGFSNETDKSYLIRYFMYKEVY